jgi:hypothetical protein
MKRLPAVAALVLTLLAAGGVGASRGDVILRGGAIYTLDP